MINVQPMQNWVGHFVFHLIPTKHRFLQRRLPKLVRVQVSSNGLHFIFPNTCQRPGCVQFHLFKVEIGMADNPEHGTRFEKIHWYLYTLSGNPSKCSDFLCQHWLCIKHDTILYHCLCTILCFQFRLKSQDLYITYITYCWTDFTLCVWNMGSRKNTWALQKQFKDQK